MTPALYWMIDTNTSCYYTVGKYQRCGAQGLVKETNHGILTFEGLCQEHMGSHMWIGDDGVLYQWRADPPYINKPLKTYQRWRRHVPAAQ